MEILSRFRHASSSHGKAAQTAYSFASKIFKAGRDVLERVGIAAEETEDVLENPRTRRGLYAVVSIVCTLGLLFFVLIPTIRYYNALMDRQAAQERLEAVQHQQRLKEIVQPAARVDALPDTPRRDNAVARKTEYASTAKLTGKIAQYSLEGWPIIGRSTAFLSGVERINLSQLDNIKAFLKQQGNYLNCHHVTEGRFRCLTKQKIDIAHAILLNGAALASTNAPENYKDAEEQAHAAKRGMWK